MSPCPGGARSRSSLLSGSRDLTFVSTGLELDGGGRAMVGRLLAAACERFAGERGIPFRILTLGRDGAAGITAATRAFAGDRRGLAATVWRSQMRGERTAWVYDLLGPARVQACLPSFLQAPYLVFLHGIEVWRRLSWDRARALGGATVLVANSNATVARARAAGTALGEVGIVPLALEERPPAGPADCALLDRVGDGFLLIVGRMAAGERYKGHDEVLDAVPHLAGSGCSPRLVVAGEGDDRPRLEARAAEMGLARQVIFTGFVSEATLAELYRRSAALVLPSRGEGFGLVYLEAMRAGKPCVAARGGAAEEVVADRATGFLVDPGDPAELLSALRLLLDSPDLAHAMGEAGRRRWREAFGAERFHALMAGHLERLLSGTREAAV